MGIQSNQLDLDRPSQIPPRKAEIEKTCRGIGHDFNGILANVRGLVEITQMMEPNAPENVQNTFNKILALVDRGHHATELVRMYGRVLSCEKSQLNVKRNLRRLLNDVKMQYELSYNIAYECPEETTIEFDENQFETMLSQLCKNSLFAMDAKGVEPDLKVRVTQTSDTHIQLSVSDNGQGMASDVGDKVWFPFYSTKKAAEGLGLGLSVVKQIVMNHDGHIHYTSTVEGGSTFVCDLPVVAN